MATGQTRDARLITKRTSVPGKIPTGTTLQESNFIRSGELASNLADKKLFGYDGVDVFEYGSNSFLSFTGGTISGNLIANSISATTISGGTIYSGSTDLYNIFQTTADGNDITRVQSGTNTFTGGTANNPTVNVTALTISTLIVSGNTNLQGLTAATFSATTANLGTILSGGTNLNNIFTTPDQNNSIYVIRTGDTMTGRLVVNLSGGTGTTAVNGIFVDYLPTTTGKTAIEGYNRVSTYGYGIYGSYNWVAFGVGVFGLGYNGLNPPSLTQDIGVYGSSSDIAMYSNGNFIAGLSSTAGQINISNTASAGIADIYTTSNTPLRITNSGFGTVGASLQLKSSSENYLFSFEGHSGFRYYSRNSSAPKFIVDDNGSISLASAATFSSSVTAFSLSATSITATTYYNLPSDSHVTGFTYNDSNKLTISNSTGGTLSATINMMTGLTVAGTLSATTSNSGIILSGGTNLYSIFQTTADGNDITRVQGGVNVFTGGTENNPTINVTALTINTLTVTGNTNLQGLTATTFSATTANIGIILSGGTNLYSIFQTTADGNDITRVQPGTNTFTGGTVNSPTINVTALTINTLTATGNTNLQGITGSSMMLSGSGQNILTIIGSGSTNPLFIVSGSTGELFSVSDSMDGSLYQINDVSGNTIVEVFSDTSITLGSYNAPSLYATTATTANSGATSIYSFPTSGYTGTFVDYTVLSTLGARAGSMMGIFSGTSVQYTETSTNDIGNTSSIEFLMTVSGGIATIKTSASTDSWTVKTIIRSI